MWLSIDTVDGTREKTPLMWAQSAAAARLLIAYGADVNAESEYQPGFSPILASIANKREDVLAVLLEAGADPNAEGFGVHPLFCAIFPDSIHPVDSVWGNYDVEIVEGANAVEFVKLLLDAGALPTDEIIDFVINGKRYVENRKEISELLKAVSNE